MLTNEILRKIVFARTMFTVIVSSNSLKFSKTLRRLLLLVSCIHSIIAVIMREKDAKLIISNLNNYVRLHRPQEDEDYNKVADLSLAKLVLVFVLVLLFSICA